MTDEPQILDPAAAEAAAEAAAIAAAEALIAALAAVPSAPASPLLAAPDILPAPKNKAGVVGFGPTFEAELQAAGVFGMLFTWSTDHVTFDPAISAADQAKVTAVVAAHNPDAVPVAIPPDCPSLAYWLTALDIWQRTDSSGKTGTATSQVQASITALVQAGNPLGTLAARQFGNANTVVLTDLLKIAPAFGFTAADCAESLWRANQVSLGDMRGVWPLPAAS